MSGTPIRARLRRPLGQALACAAMVAITTSWTTGCSFIRLTINDTIVAEDVAFIVSGHTTLRDIVERLGTPDEMREAPDGALILYHFHDANYSRVNFGHILKFWTPVQPDLVLSNIGLGTEVFEVAFDEHWVARQHAFTRHPLATSHVPWPF
jgi:hypothetical protein